RSAQLRFGLALGSYYRQDLLEPSVLHPAASFGPAFGFCRIEWPNFHWVHSYYSEWKLSNAIGIVSK
ncbi:MAG: hypothetical protein LUF68_09660, partial [Clostridiales bacterium]|nr:hypothetical protein [Clostridiales bacterium]